MRKWIVTAAARGFSIRGDWPHKQKAQVAALLEQHIRQNGKDAGSLDPTEIHWGVQVRSAPLPPSEMVSFAEAVTIAAPEAPRRGQDEAQYAHRWARRIIRLAIRNEWILSVGGQTERDRLLDLCGTLRQLSKERAKKRAITRLTRDGEFLSLGAVAKYFADQGTLRQSDKIANMPEAYRLVISALEEGKFDGGEIGFLDDDGRIVPQRSAALSEALISSLQRGVGAGTIGVVDRIWIESAVCHRWALDTGRPISKDWMLLTIPSLTDKLEPRTIRDTDAEHPDALSAIKAKADPAKRPTPLQRRIIKDIEEAYGSLANADEYSVPEIKYKLGKDYSDSSLKRVLGRTR